MKFLRLFFLLIFTPIAIGVRSSSIASAMSQILNKVAADQIMGMQVVAFGNQTDWIRIEKIINLLGKSLKVPLIWDLDRMNNPFPSVNRSAILLYPSWEFYDDRFIFINFDIEHQNDLYLLNYIDDEIRFDMIENIQRKDPEFTIHSRFYRENFIEFNETSIALTTFDTFHKPNCRSYHRIEVNQFMLETQKWRDEKFSADKFKDFNGCELVIYMIMPQNLAVRMDFDKNGELTVQGYLRKFYDLISNKLNFSIFYNPTERVQATWYVADWMTEYITDDYPGNRSVSLDLRGLLTSYRRILNKRAFKAVTTTRGITQIEEIVLISRSKPYTMLEKVFLPFEPAVWCGW
jgi:hypothetical protein